jgi:hypothetical protein
MSEFIDLQQIPQATAILLVLLHQILLMSLDSPGPLAGSFNWILITT